MPEPTKPVEEPKPKPEEPAADAADEPDADDGEPAADDRKKPKYNDDDLEAKIQHRLRKLRAENDRLVAEQKKVAPSLQKLADLESAGKTETEKLREQLTASQAETKRIQDEHAQVLAASRAELEDEIIGRTIVEVAGKMKLGGCSILKRDLLATRQLKVETDDSGKREVFAEDAAGRHVPVQAFIESHLKSLGEEDVFSPRTPGGSGGRAGVPARGAGPDLSKMTPAEKISYGYKQAEAKGKA
jgi:Skp family chaperone for outer membrane proteins